jgi:hypothetical protein
LPVGHLDDRMGQMKLGRPQGNQTEHRSYNPLAQDIDIASVISTADGDHFGQEVHARPPQCGSAAQCREFSQSLFGRPVKANRSRRLL